MNLTRYRKAIAAAVLAVTSGLPLVLPGGLTLAEAGGLLAAAVTALVGVWAIPNDEPSEEWDGPDTLF